MCGVGVDDKAGARLVMDSYTLPLQSILIIEGIVGQGEAEALKWTMAYRT